MGPNLANCHTISDNNLPASDQHHSIRHQLPVLTLALVPQPSLRLDFPLRSRSFPEIKEISLEALRYMDFHSILCIRACILLEMDPWILLDGFNLNEHLRNWVVVFCPVALSDSN